MIIGFIFGLWLYYLYSGGGLSLMLTEGWKGLLVALAFSGVIILWDRIIGARNET